MPWSNHNSALGPTQTSQNLVTADTLDGNLRLLRSNTVCSSCLGPPISSVSLRSGPRDQFLFMKAKSIIWHPMLILLLASDNVLGQGSFYFSNIYLSVNAPVFDASGQRLEGPNYLAELYGGVTADALSPAISASSGGRVATPFLTGPSAGYFRDGTVYFDSVPGYGWAWLEVRAWDARLGPTYEDVVAQGIGGFGESALFYAKGGDIGDILGLPGVLVGLQSFSLRAVVPEPSSALSLLLGLPALLFLNRRRRRK